MSMNAACLGNIGKKSFERSLGTLLGGWLGYCVAMARLVKLRSPVRLARVSALGIVPCCTMHPLDLPCAELTPLSNCVLNTEAIEHGIGWWCMLLPMYCLALLLGLPGGG